MKTKTRTIVVCVVITISTLLAVGWAVDAGDPCNQLPEGWPCHGWPLGGAWLQSVEPTGPMTPDAQPAIIYETLTPLDPAGDVFAYRQTYANPDTTLGGLLPDADLGGEMVGTAVRTGPNTYSFTLIGYPAKTRSNNRGLILGILVSSGTMTLTGPNTRMDSNIAMSLYGPDADISPADGLPDDGTEPMLCVGFPEDYVVKRIPLMPPCTPTPMPPQQ
jgi:hypothetical protein